MALQQIHKLLVICARSLCGLGKPALENEFLCVQAKHTCLAQANRFIWHVIMQWQARQADSQSMSLAMLLTHIGCRKVARWGQKAAHRGFCKSRSALGHAVGVHSKVNEFPGDVTGQGDERVAFACLGCRACCLELAQQDPCIARSAAHPWKLAGLLLWRPPQDCKSCSSNKRWTSLRNLYAAAGCLRLAEVKPSPDLHVACIRTSETQLKHQAWHTLTVRSLLQAMPQKQKTGKVRMLDNRARVTHLTWGLSLIC